MLKQKIKYFIIVSSLSTVGLIAEVNLEENVYSAAEEMMAFDEKMNRLIAQHNGIEYNEDETRIKIEDFEETQNGYRLERKIHDSNNTKIELTVKNEILTISTTKETKEKTVDKHGSSYETTTSQSTTSLYLPNDVNPETMEESFKDGILKIQFQKNK
ncbi:MAG: Unknown protein [uncultured Sulfurovum sp.]|uniref:SHSP domain-containing protein n=1 Tax=uncultured Sulfurovum sp. TaxID=269237 RepID=A0A6S6S4T9_9BACT|nr:MAG: Unknown protein [uncultured Sulfurovum sp.]